MFTAALFIVAKTWNQPKCPSMIDWTRKMWHTYTMEYYAAIKNDEFVSFVGTWMNLETIILSKLTQVQKIKHHMFSFIGGCWTMRTQGHREGSIIHWGLLGVPREGHQGLGRSGTGNMGKNARCRWWGKEAANRIAMSVPMQQSCMICTCTLEPKVQPRKRIRS